MTVISSMICRADVEYTSAGIKASFSSTLSGHLGVGYSNGADVESPWNAVAGVNWSF